MEFPTRETRQYNRLGGLKRTSEHRAHRYTWKRPGMFQNWSSCEGLPIACSALCYPIDPVVRKQIIMQRLF